jgi:hypothetical protein
VEILHVFQLGIIRYLLRDFMSGLNDGNKRKLEAHWRAFNTDSLNIPPIQALFMVNHYKSFIGKHMKIVIQAAPFVFFPFMTQEQKELWSALGLLCTYVYQTKIDDMEQYIADLKHHIDVFLYHVLRMTAQWVNKPKFHMLTHLPDAIRRFGPACLFASEKFESFNGILCNASIHSNRQSPGRDIAITFENYQAMRLILSGAYLYDHRNMHHFQPSLNVTEVFRTNKGIQNLMGIDMSYEPNYPIVIKGEVPDQMKDKTPIPTYLKNVYPTARWKSIRTIKTSKYDSVHRGIFVLVSNHSPNPQDLHIISSDNGANRSKDKTDPPTLLKYQMYGKPIHSPVQFSLKHKNTNRLD